LVAARRGVSIDLDAVVVQIDDPVFGDAALAALRQAAIRIMDAT